VQGSRAAAGPRCPRRCHHQFIDGYKRFLLFAADPEDAASDLHARLASGRDVYLEERSLLDSFLEQQTDIEDWVVEAIRNIEVADWVYLRDTKKYSLFVRADQSAAFAVAGLTERIRNILGYSGILVRTGIFPLGEKYVCDGLIVNRANLDVNYKKGLSPKVP
jgi:hypothetical protein